MAYAEVPRRRVMWSAALMTHPLAERLDAAAAEAFDALSVFPADMKRWRSEGLTDTEISRIVRGSGVAIVALDPYTGWCPGWSLDGLDEFTRNFIDVREDDIWRMAEALGTDQVNCVESAGADYDHAAYADALGAFADRARAHGLMATLEFMPTSKIGDLREALDLLRDVGEGVQMTFDTWHFWRSASDPDLIGEIPDGLIREVQIADGGAEVIKDLQTDLLYHRRLPGDGDFNLAHIIAALDARGWLRSVGPETFSAEMSNLSAAEAVRRNRVGMEAVLAAAGKETPA